MVCVFARTHQGSETLRAVLGAGVKHENVSVIGDMGLPAGTTGAEHHVTFDALHVPPEDRPLLMETVRTGGVVLAVRCDSLGTEVIARLAAEHHALKVLRVEADAKNPSHNPAA